MSSTRKSAILCFTASYPFGMRETYFDNELQYLSEAFEQVYILPTYNATKSNEQRKVPRNTIVLPIAVPQGVSRIIQGIFNLSPAKAFISDMLKHKVYRKKSNFIKWINAFLVFRIKYQKLQSILKKVEPDVLLYSYWGGPVEFTTKLCKPYRKIIRMHGGDFYLNRNDGYLPLRRKIYQSADLLLPISNNIAAILGKEYQIEPKKIFLNYLGVNNHETIKDIAPDDTIRIVSCSNLVPLKRVQIIASTICKWNNKIKIEWHHFGDGPEMKNISSLIKSCNKSNTNIFLHGWTSTKAIYNFYNSHYITWLINVSKYEGVPVSVMEAFAFGIPAIATNTGATSEIVNDTNGLLIDLNVTEEILEACIRSCYEKNYPEKRKQARADWEKKFNAESNYMQLVNKLKSLI